MRPSGREADALREIKFTRQYTKHAEGSVFVEYGDTQVICTASVVDGVPRFLRESPQGWLTAEYGMLPRATHTRSQREAARGRQSGRTQEIQRLIGRSLRSCVDLKALGDYTLHIDCDVIQADGGTRTASISGSCVAVYDALQSLKAKKSFRSDPFRQFIASVSVGIYQGQVVLDLDYIEDSNAETDMNVVMTEHSGFIEVQGTAEGEPFVADQFNEMLDFAKRGIDQIVAAQKAAVQD